MATLRKTTNAEEDLYQAWAYLAQDSIVAADNMIRSIAQTLDLLCDSPQLGQRVDHLRTGLRRFIVGNYAIYYLREDDAIIVIRVLHEARDRDALL